MKRRMEVWGAGCRGARRSKRVRDGVCQNRSDAMEGAVGGWEWRLEEIDTMELRLEVWVPGVGAGCEKIKRVGDSAIKGSGFTGWGIGRATNRGNSVSEDLGGVSLVLNMGLLVGVEDESAVGWFGYVETVLEPA
eukprot:jgi/Psemu1/56565/gm1.56565_g